MRPCVSTIADDDVNALFLELVRVFEHLIRLTYTGRRADIDAKFRTLVFLDHFEQRFRGRAEALPVWNFGCHGIYKHNYRSVGSVVSHLVPIQFQIEQQNIYAGFAKNPNCLPSVCLATICSRSLSLIFRSFATRGI